MGFLKYTIDFTKHILVLHKTLLVFLDYKHGIDKVLTEKMFRLNNKVISMNTGICKIRI